MTRQGLGSTLLVAVAMILANLPLRSLTSDARLLPAVVIVVVGLQGLAWVARRLGLPEGLVNLGQTVVLLGVLGRLWIDLAPADQEFGVRFGQVLDDTTRAIMSSVAPMPAHDGVLVLLLLLAGVFTIIADLLFVTCWSPAMAGVAVFGPYLVPALILRADLMWWFFPTTALAWLLLLARQTSVQSSSWTAHVAADHDRAPLAPTAPAWTLAALTTCVAVFGAFALGSWLPTLGTGIWSGVGSGRGGALALSDPTIDLERNLRQPSNEVVLTYTSNVPEGLYLRMTSLTRLEASGWTQMPATLRAGYPDEVPGRGQPPVAVTADISIGDFASAYLPAPYAPRAYDVLGNWSYDPLTLMIYNTDRGNQDATVGLTYRVRSTDQGPSEERALRAVAAIPEGAPETALLDPDVPSAVIELAHRITSGATSDGSRAAALQDYLRDPNRFTYTLDAPPGDGYDVLTSFLFETRAGYCVHFASAMATMARAVGIPSRVAVGFMTGEREGDQYVVRAHDMHAWPELYFEGLGWVRYEPTVGVATAPTWSDGESDTGPGNPSAEPSAEPSSVPEEEPSTIPQDQPSAEPTDPGAQTDSPIDVATRGPWLPLGLLLVVLASPAALRVGLRRRRLASGRSPAQRAEGAWVEVRATAIDHGIGWPPGTPSEVAGALSNELDADTSRAITSLATTLDHAHYARTHDDTPELAEWTDVARTGMNESSSTKQRILAVVAPASLWKK